MSGDGPSKDILTLGETVAELLPSVTQHQRFTPWCLVHWAGFSGTA